MKESLTVNSFCVISDSMGTKNFASVYVGEPIAERIGLNGGNPFIRVIILSHHMISWQS